MQKRRDTNNLQKRGAVTTSSKLTVPFIKFILTIICKVHSEELKKIPNNGPLIIAVNHINFLEVPLLFTFLRPRPVYGMVKKETWDNKFLGFLAKSWEAIPIDRAGSNISSFRKAAAIIRNNGIIIMAPEGTRSKTGLLQEGNPGIVSLAAQTNTPIIPLVHYGGEKFWKNLKTFRRTHFHIKTGTPFFVRKEVNSKKRSAAADEVMLQIARYLPNSLKGIYKDRQITTQYIELLEEK